MAHLALLRRLPLLGVLAFASAVWGGDVPLSDGQNAEDVIGQFDGSGNPVFDQGTPFNSQRLEGLNLTYNVAVDTTNHRLFIADNGSSRVLQYDLNSSNVLVDRSPDHVLGQSNFYWNRSSLAQNRMGSPFGLAYDSTSNRLFVSDYSYHRVLVFDVSTITDGENAVNVLGQSLFTTNTAATSINGMRNPYGLALDASNRLFVADSLNHRLLVFDVTTITDGENAISVLGQSDFTSGTNATLQNRMYNPRHVQTDGVSRLFLSDNLNNRVLVFDVASITDGENAINVLGQLNFTSSSSSVAQNRMSYPMGLSYSSTTQRLFVGDYGNHRALMFDVAAVTDGENAVNVLGQSNFSSSSSGTTQNRMYYPIGLALDDGANRLYVTELYNYRVTAFDVSTTSITDGQNAENVVGQTDGAGGAVYTTYNGYDGVTQQGMDYPYDVVVDTTAHRIFIADNNANRVLVYHLDASNTLVDRTPDNVLGQSDFKTIRPVTSQSSIYAPQGLAYDSATNRLFVANYGNSRVTVFDVATITDGENAVNVLGQTNFTNSSGATSQSGLRNPVGVSFEPTTSRLYVGDYGNHRVMVYDVAAITDGENAVNVLGQPDFTTGNSATQQNRLNIPYGVVVDNSNRLFVADAGNHRVMVFNVSTTTIANGQNAENVLGQSLYTTASYARTQNTMNSPRNLAMDNGGNRLFVSDYFNHRVLVFLTTAIANGQNAMNVLGQPNFTAGTAVTSQNGLYYPRGLNYEAGMNRLYISEFYNSRVSVQSVGPVPPSTSTLTAVAGSQTGKINLSWPSAGDDGAFNNLTGSYRIQYATYTATWSTESTPTNATMLTISTTNVAPGVVQSTTIAGLNTGTTYFFALFTSDEIPNWSTVSNTASAQPPNTVTLAEAVGQAGWMGRGETQRILGTAQVVSDSSSGLTISSVAVQASGYTADGNLTNAEVWVSSSGYIDANAVRLENTAKAFSSNGAVFTQDVVVSTTPLYFIARSDVSGSATEGTFEIALQVFANALTANNPLGFSNATDVVAPPMGTPSGLTATGASNLLQVNLSWSSASGVDSYTIYRATHSGVTTTDFLLGMTNTTSFADDYLPPNQEMYYTVTGSNRAGGTSPSTSANATSVDVPALTTGNIYLRAGVPGGFGDGNMAYREALNSPSSTGIDNAGNIYIADRLAHRIRFIPKSGGTYFGQGMKANAIYTIAGDGTAGYVADNVAATSTRLHYPTGVSVDAGGNLYIAEPSNHRIRFIPRNGGTYFGQAMTANFIYTIAGDGTAGYVADNVAATSTPINNPTDVSVDAGGNVSVADFNNHRIRFIPRNAGTYFGQAMTAHFIYTIAGNGTAGYVADNVAATSTPMNNPYGVSFDAAGNLYFSDRSNHRIRFIPKTSGTYFGQAMAATHIHTIAGNGTSGYLGDNGAATVARLFSPSGVSVDGGGNVYIADINNHRIRFIPRKGGTYFGQAMTVNFIYTIAGNGTGGYLADNGAATLTPIYSPTGVSVDAGGNVFIADFNNNRIRFIPKSGGAYFGQTMTANSIYTIAGNRSEGYGGDGAIATTAQIQNPFGIAVDSASTIILADTDNNRIRFVPKTGGTFFGQTMAANSIYTIAGNGTAGYTTDGVAANTTPVNSPFGVSFDSGGNVYIGDRSNHRVRFVPKTGGTYFGQSMTANSIYTIAGNGAAGYVADGVAATSTPLNQPRGVRVDKEGNVYLADSINNRIRFIPNTGGTNFGQGMTANYIYTIAGTGTAGYDGDDVAANATRLNVPFAVSVDVRGNVYIADKTNQRIRFIAKTSGIYFGQTMTANYIYTIAGGGAGFANGVLATTCQLYDPNGVETDLGGNVYIAETLNARIRFIPKADGTYFGQTMTANYIYTIAGNGNGTYNGENALATTKAVGAPTSVFAGVDHMVYFSGNFNDKIRMIAGEDFIAPSTSTLVAMEGSVNGGVDLSWASAGNDGSFNTLSGNYRIQYATTAATAWSTSSTPTGAYTTTIPASIVTPGVVQSTSVVVGLAQPWYFVIWTQDDANNWSAISSTASASPYVPPPPPSTASFTGRSENTISADWAPSVGASSYTFVVSAAPDNPPVSVAGSSNTVALSATVNSLTPNTTYFGFAKACDGVGCSAFTAFGSTVTWATPPLTLSTSSLASTSVSLAWIANNNPAGTTYEIEQATGLGGPFSFTTSTTGVNTSIIGLSPATTACFRILARSWDGIPTAPTSEICVVPPFSTPGSSAISASGANAILASWTVAPGATSYTFTVSTASDNPPLVVSGSSSTVSLSASVSSLTPNTTYFGFVKGCHGVNCSNDTALGSAVTLASVPTGLSSGTVTAGCVRIMGVNSLSI